MNPNSFGALIVNLFHITLIVQLIKFHLKIFIQVIKCSGNEIFFKLDGVELDDEGVVL
jgi:hypothetical protein